MKRYRLSLQIFTSLFSLCAMGQIANLEISPGRAERDKKSDEVVIGSRFINESYEKCIIEDFSGNSISAFARFDALNNEVELHNDGNPVIIKKYLYPEVRIEYFDEGSNKKIEIRFRNKFKISGFKEDYYFDVIEETNEYFVLKNYTMDVVVSKDTGYGEGSTTKKQFIPGSEYYVLKGDNVYQVKKLKKGEIFSLFEDSKDEFKSYMKKNKIRMDSEEDLIKVIAFANEIEAL